MQFYATPIFESETDILCSLNDIVCTGIWDNPLFCISSNKLGLEAYIMHLTHQKFREIDALKSERHINEPKKVREREIDPAKLGQDIMNNYIGVMMDAIRRGEKGEFAELRNDLIAKTAKIPHVGNDILNLCRIIEFGQRGEKTLHLVEAYVRKIGAINVEDYLEAAKYRDMIRELEKG